MEDQVEKLKKQLEEVRKQRDEWQEKYATLQKDVDSKNASKHQHNKLLDTLGDEMSLKPDKVKELVSDGTISMTDVDSEHMTLLSSAARRGIYSLVQLCINLGADINHTDSSGKKPIDHANEGAWFHVEELLQFGELNANVSDRVKTISYDINKQNGIAANIINELNDIVKDAHQQQFFQDTLMQILCNLIGKRLSFSDDILNLCWFWECQKEDSDPFASKLWQVIHKTSNDVIQNGSKRDWWWFKKFLLSSTV